ncbi:NKG2-A/NKG2-B type II integral membrane protein-like [Sorex araneus]|uniref:NKG2-A/NKG2-B type II integral membrane protein-like n=1 Tax=Sorex araneus TaxID=42254 RepID=UPI002433BFDD|nr:NKG2-A/NKG2-B type II integral membrane protein-like [Sorex araneus]
MSNERVTYAEVNRQKDSKRQQREKKDSKSSVTETTPEITYTELNLQNESQDPQGNNKQCRCRGFLSPPKKLIAGILGLVCLVMVIIVTTAIPSSEMQQSNSSSLESRIQKADFLTLKRVAKEDLTIKYQHFPLLRLALTFTEQSVKTTVTICLFARRPGFSLEDVQAWIPQKRKK